MVSHMARQFDHSLNSESIVAHELGTLPIEATTVRLKNFILMSFDDVVLFGRIWNEQEGMPLCTRSILQKGGV